MRKAKFKEGAWYPVIQEYKMAIQHGDVYFVVFANPPGVSGNTKIPKNLWSGSVACYSYSTDDQEKARIFSLWAPVDIGCAPTRKEFAAKALAEAKKLFEIKHQFAGTSNAKQKAKSKPKRPARRSNGHAQVGGHA